MSVYLTVLLIHWQAKSYAETNSSFSGATHDEEYAETQTDFGFAPRVWIRKPSAQRRSAGP